VIQQFGGGCLSRRFFIGCCLALGLFQAAGAEAAGDYLAQLQSRAQAARLAESPAWLRLLHYEPRTLGRGWISAITDADFFAADAGRTDPDAELRATLALFFTDNERDGEPPQCRFRARYQWLSQQLRFDPQHLPVQQCARYEAWVRGLAVERMALVFASADLESPSTLFGHTLLRLDGREQVSGEVLLAYAVNYAALTGPEAGPLYAVRGLFGGYDGYFGLFPYYEKVKEYVRIEYRDLWEYPLRLDPDDQARLLDHLWEMRGIGIRYYFLSRNCSYQLLAALEAVRPDLVLTPQFREFPPHAIPLDTVRELQRLGLLGEPTYRPSLARQLQARYQQLLPALREWVLAYADGQVDLEDPQLQQATPIQQALALELAHELLFLRFSEGRIEREQGLPPARAALLARSRISEPSTVQAPPRPSQPPEASHASARLRVGLRAVSDGTRGLLGVRPAYHDRLDPGHDYLTAGEIQFLDFDLSFDRERLRLDQLRILSIEAISPRTALFQPWSWFVDSGLRPTALAAEDPGSLGGYLDLGRGLAWSPVGGMHVYAFAVASAEANRDRPRGGRLAAGSRLGLAWQRGPGLSFDARLEGLHAFGPDLGAEYAAEAGLQWSWARNDGLRLRWRHERNEDGAARSSEHVLDLSWMIYF
jgi:hypothetical protein